MLESANPTSLSYMTVSMMVLPMQTRRTLLIGVFLGTACAAIASRALGADLTALPFVTNIYNGYKGNDSPGHALDTEGAIRRYFEPSLAALMVKDRKLAAKRGEVGVLDFDPFVDAQEWDIADFDIAVAETAPGKATATVGERRPCLISSRSRTTGASTTSPGRATASRKPCAGFTCTNRAH